MAKKRYINTKFWDDNYIVELDPIEKLLFLYFLTTPLTDICGIYEIPMKRISFDTGIDKNMVIKIVDRFSKDNKIFYINGWIYIKNFSKHQAINDKIKIGIERSIKEVPDEIMAKIKEMGIDYDSLYIDYELLKPKPKPKLYTEKENSKKISNIANEFVKYFFERYKELSGNPPIMTSYAKYNKKAQRFLNIMSLEELKQKLELYFKSEDKFIKENKYSIDAFLNDNIINKLK